MPIIIHAEDRGNPAKLASGSWGVREFGPVCGESSQTGQLNFLDPMFTGPRSGSSPLGSVCSTLRHTFSVVRACTPLYKPVAPEFISFEEQHLHMYDKVIKETDLTKISLAQVQQ